MGESVLARRYAASIMNLAETDGQIDKLASDFEIIKSLISDNSGWLRILDDVKAPQKLKEKLIDEVAASAGLYTNLVKLLKLLSEKRRCFLLPGIIWFFQGEFLTYRNEVETEVTVADELVWNALRSETAKTVQIMTNKKPVFKVNIDPEIIGGIILKIKDRIYDGSVVGELNRMKKRLLEGKYEIFRR